MDGLDKSAVNKEYEIEATEAMILFRNALAELMPIFQKTDIKWNMLDENDDYYALCESLFNMIVINKFSNIAERKHVEMKEFANYGFHHKTLKDLNYIEVKSYHHPDAILSFNYILSKNKPLDIIVCNMLDKQGKVIDANVEAEFDKSDFTFRFK